MKSLSQSFGLQTYVQKIHAAVIKYNWSPLTPWAWLCPFEAKGSQGNTKVRDHVVDQQKIQSASFSMHWFARIPFPMSGNPSTHPEERRKKQVNKKELWGGSEGSKVKAMLGKINALVLTHLKKSYLFIKILLTSLPDKKNPKLKKKKKLKKALRGKKKSLPHCSS